MPGPENTFIASVHRHLPVSLYRMKNHNEYNGGIADVWYSGPKADLWVEYKFVKVPARDRTVIDLINAPVKRPGSKTKPDSIITSLQQEWLASRHTEGRNVAVVVGSADGGAWFSGTDWDMTFTAGEFRRALVSRQQIAQLIVSATVG